MDFKLINLLSTSTLDVIRLDLDETWRKIRSEIEAEEKEISSARLKDSGYSLVSIAEMDSSVRRNRDSLERICVQLNFIESAQQRRVA